MTNRQIETSREIRLWVVQVLIPAIGAGLVIASPTIRNKVSEKIKSIHDKIFPETTFKEGTI